MLEGQILVYNKDTEKKFRWSNMVGDTKFNLYIPDWRVPQPVPRRVRVVIYLPGDKVPDLSQLKCSDAASSPELLQSSIVAKVLLTKPHTKTTRYDPIGDPKNLEIGSPYIPDKLLPKEPPSELTISVEWLTD